VRRLSSLFFSVLASGPLVVVLVAGGPWSGEELAREARVLDASGEPRLRSDDGVEFVLEQPVGRIVPATAAAVDIVTQLVDPPRVASLPQAAFSFSKLALDPGDWTELPRFAGYSAEVLLEAQPDLVLAASWQSPETNAALRAAGVPVLVLSLPTTWDDVLDDLWLVAVALGAEERGRALADALEQRVAALAERSFAGLRAISYTNLGTGGWVAGSGTTTDIVFDLLGLENAAGTAGLIGHRELDLEGLIALAPELILVGEPDEREGIASTLAYLQAQPALADVPAMRAGLVISLPQELFSTASTELLSAAERLADELESRRAPPH
jgi:iron complex transport system substrate-binding protein